MGACVCLFVAGGSCAPLDNGVPKFAVDFMVLLGKVGVFRLQVVILGVICSCWFWVLMMCFGCLLFTLFTRFVVFSVY